MSSVLTKGHQRESNTLPTHGFQIMQRIAQRSKSTEPFFIFPPGSGLRVSLGHVSFFSLSRWRLAWKNREGRSVGRASGGEKRRWRVGRKQDSDIHALRHGDTDKVSSPPLGQAVITVSLHFQVATLSGTGIIGSRLGATNQPQCGPAMPLCDVEAWLRDIEHTHIQRPTDPPWQPP